MDIVWDIYLKDSLKLSTRTNKLAGTLKRVSSYPGMSGFCRIGKKYYNDDDHDELFQFLGQECVSKAA